MHVGKEYTLCRVITIRIAVFTVKDVSWEGSSVGPVSVFGGKIINLSIRYFAEFYYLITNTVMDIFDIMNIKVVNIIVTMHIIVD